MRHSTVAVTVSLEEPSQARLPDHDRDLTSITVGDLHANILKAITAGIIAGVFQIEPKDYSALVHHANNFGLKNPLSAEKEIAENLQEKQNLLRLALK